MKKQIIALVVLLIALGVWAYFWAQSKEEANVAPVGEQVADDNLPLGPQIIYQTTRVKDRGSDDAADDDVEETIIYRADMTGKSTVMATIDSARRAASPRAEIIGQDIFVHNYTDGHDVWLNLEGVTDVSGNRSNDNIANTDNRLANRDSSVWVDYSLEYENRAAAVTMRIGWLGMDEALNEHVTLEPPEPFELDPAELGITLGYAVPFVISDDGKTVYIREICECDAISLRGLWRFDIATQTLTKITYIVEQDVEEYKINSATKQLIGVSYAHDGPETDFGGGAPSGPSAIHLVDLQTGDGKEIFSSDTFVFGSAFLSPDGMIYAHDYRDDIVRVRAVGAQRQNSDDVISGNVLDWVDDTLIVDRDGEIILYDLTTDMVTSVARTIGGRYADPDI